MVKVLSVPTPSSPRSSCWLDALLLRRHGGIAIFYGVFLALALVTRVAFTVREAHDLEWNLGLLAAFSWGLVFDLAAAGWSALPLILALTFLPASWGAKSWQRALTHAVGAAVLFILLFNIVAEWTFWDEFGVRYNFIAVDYLVYTTEVLGNIRESYNLPAIFAGLAAVTAVVGFLVWKTGCPSRWLAAASEPISRRLRAGAAWLAVVVALGSVLSQDHLPAFANEHAREIAKNGVWSLFAAFRNNVLDYDRFYKTAPPAQTYARLQQKLVLDGSQLLRAGQPDSLRWVRNAGPELRLNVIQVTVESLSADFLGIFTPDSTLTPNLDALAPRSLVFENFYATGNRTDRGMEALTLSLPPTPGRSLIKRPANENLFTLGSLFRAKGYDTAFIYGGFGYFDNMNHFFGSNGYRVIDRRSVAANDVTFANVWGACDEDLFRWTIREADAAHAAGKPFHYFVMTTSNHRPYTFPEGRIDLPSKVSGRRGAVKYTDYAIGALIREAANKPWFKNTVFVVVADHCASSAGKTELPVHNYHIPLFIYAPGGQIAPGRIHALTSQVDFAPTLLGLLNWSYPSRFFGHDVRRIAERDAHALIGNYQKLGYMQGDRFVILRPRQGVATYRVGNDGNTLTPIADWAEGEQDAIAYYASASHAYRLGLYKELTEAEHALSREEAGQLPPAAK